MKTLFLFAVAALLVFGCVRMDGGNGTNLAPAQTNNSASHVNTANISFYRNGSLPSVPAPPISAPKPAPATHYNFSAVTNATGSLIVYYFHSAECSACRAFAPDMAAIEKRHPEVEFRDYDLSTANGSRAYDDYLAQQHIPPEKQYIPQVFVNGTATFDRFAINSTLEGIIKNFTS